MTWRRYVVPLVLAVGVVTGTALASGAPSPSSAYLVETTAGPDREVVALARQAAVREGASVRVARSPSESLSVAAALVARGARRLVVHGVDERAVLTPLRASRPDVEIVRLRSR